MKACVDLFWQHPILTTLGAWVVGSLAGFFGAMFFYNVWPRPIIHQDR